MSRVVRLIVFTLTGALIGGAVGYLLSSWVLGLPL